MRGFGKRNDDLGRIERELRARRPAAREEYVDELAARTRASRPRARVLARGVRRDGCDVHSRRVRASFGGLGAAAAGASETAGQ